MELVFTTPGAYLSVKDGLFSIAIDKQKTTISPMKVERIILSTEAVLTTAVVKLCNQHNIDLVVLERNGSREKGQLNFLKRGRNGIFRKQAAADCVAVNRVLVLSQVYLFHECVRGAAE